MQDFSEDGISRLAQRFFGDAFAKSPPSPTPEFSPGSIPEGTPSVDGVAGAIPATQRAPAVPTTHVMMPHSNWALPVAFPVGEATQPVAEMPSDGFTQDGLKAFIARIHGSHIT